MPIYEYECLDCGHGFEAFQRMSDDPIAVCPNCGEHHVRRLLFAPAIHFKGKGFYNTDYGTRTRVADGGSSDGDAASKDSASKNGGAGEKAGAGAGGDSSSRGETSSGKTVGLDKV